MSPDIWLDVGVVAMVTMEAVRSHIQVLELVSLQGKRRKVADAAWRSLDGDFMVISWGFFMVK